MIRYAWLVDTLALLTGALDVLHLNTAELVSEVALLALTLGCAA